jgi:hypothetical protein
MLLEKLFFGDAVKIISEFYGTLLFIPMPMAPILLQMNSISASPLYFNVNFTIMLPLTHRCLQLFLLSGFSYQISYFLYLFFLPLLRSTCSVNPVPLVIILTVHIFLFILLAIRIKYIL